MGGNLIIILFFFFFLKRKQKQQRKKQRNKNPGSAPKTIVEFESVVQRDLELRLLESALLTQEQSSGFFFSPISVGPL